MELRQFRQFIAVADEMSFRRAAVRLHMSQPPLTAAIKKMEAELGVSLMERTSRIIRLTESGRAFLEEARRAVVQADRAVTAARRAAEGIEGRLRVTFLPFLSHDLLSRILRQFRRRYPSIALELTESATGSQIAALVNDHADIGLLVPPIPDGMPIVLETVFHDHLVAALPEGHPLASRRRITLAELKKEDWVLSPTHQSPGFGTSVVKACAEAGFVPKIAQHAVHMDTILGLIAGDLGVCLVPNKLAKPPHGVVFREVTGPGTPVKYELSAAWRHDEDKPTVKAFLQMTRLIMANGDLREAIDTTESKLVIQNRKKRLAAL
jgi:DNA-binding transcriptional LysR family regulator